MQPLAGTQPTRAFQQSFLTLRTEIDRMIEDFMREYAPPFRMKTSGYSALGRVDLEIGAAGQVAPHADLVETVDMFVVTLELPGIGEDDIEVAVVVSGNKDEGEIDDETRIHFRERRFGPFRRSFRIPDGVDRDDIGASFDRGLLTIVLPKGETDLPVVKHVEIEAR